LALSNNSLQLMMGVTRTGRAVFLESSCPVPS
jgi:hypothetical protein